MIAFDDTELNEWLMQAIEEGSGQFLPALAEAAVIRLRRGLFSRQAGVNEPEA